MRYFFIFLLGLSTYLTATPLSMNYESAVEVAFSKLSPIQGEIVSRRDIPEVGVIELLLSNGMRVCLRPNGAGDDEVLMQAFAGGGTTSLPSEWYVDSRFAPYLAWASGVGDVSASELASFLTDYDMAFSMTIYPQYRRIKASCHMHHLKLLFQHTHLRLTQQNFSPEAMPRAITLFREVMTSKLQNSEIIFEQEFYQMNTQKHPSFQAITDQDINSVNFVTAQEVFQKAFGNPAEFTVVLAGNFDFETVEPWIITYLASIPPLSETPQQWPPSKKTSLPFPEETRIQQIACGRDQESLTRVTFSCSAQLSSPSFHLLDFVSQVLETRLRENIRTKTGVTYGVDVGYEFPLFPNPNIIWMTVQYRCDRHQIKKLSRMILGEFQNLQKQGPTEEEIEAVRTLKLRMYDFWRKENVFWLAMLTNYYLWDWDLRGITEEIELLDQFDRDHVHDFLHQFFTTTSYTQITMECQK